MIRLQVLSKFLHDGLESRQVCALEIPASGAELLEQTQKMRRRAADGNSCEAFGFGERGILETLLRRERQEKAEMLRRAAERSRRFARGKRATTAA